MPHLSPQTLTQAEQAALLATTCEHPRDHSIFSPAFGTGLRLADIVGLDMQDPYPPDGSVTVRVRLRSEIAGICGGKYVRPAHLRSWCQTRRCR